MKSEKIKSKKAKVAKVLIYGFCLFFLVWIFLAPFLANLLIVEKPLERADAMWILGGSSTYLERTSKAAELYKQNVAPKIFVVNDGVFSGWNKAEQRNLPVYELARRELIAKGVPNGAIEVLPKLVEGTKDEADLLVETAQIRNLKSVLLVTSAYHSRRTFWIFQRTVLKNNLSIEIGLQTPPKSFGWFSPNDWLFVSKEYVKMAYYWVFY